MMRLALSILLLFSLRTFGAVGDITGGYVSTNGWDTWLHISGLATNGTYAMGLATNNTIVSTTKVSVTWTSLAYSGATATTATRTNWLVSPVQLVATGPTYNEEVDSGSGVWVRLANHEWIRANDSTLVLTALAGFYTAGGASNNPVSGLVLTNLSMQVHQPPDVNWTWPGFNWETNTTLTLRAIGFHGSAENRKPLEAMQFVVTAPNGNSVTNTETVMVLLPMTNDITPLAEFVSVFNVAALTNAAGTNIFPARCDLVGYGRYGDTNAVFDTRRNVFTGVTPLPASITNLVDPLRQYTDLRVRVGLDGNDTNGRPTNGVVAAGHKFLTISAARNAAKGTNNVRFGHNDDGGVICEVDAGITNLSGGADAPLAYCWIMPTAGNSVIITNSSSSVAGCTRLTGMEIRGTPNYFISAAFLWFDRCTISNANANALIQSTPIVWATYCNLQKVPEGIRGFSSQNSSWMTRGNYLQHFAGNYSLRMSMGNYHPGGQVYTIVTDYTTSATPPPWEHAISYGDRFMGIQAGANAVNIGANIGIRYGTTLANSVFEISTNQTVSAFTICCVNTLQYTNVKIFNCIFVGKRTAGVFYNDSGSAAAWRIQCVGKNNIFDNTGFKSWNFGTTNIGRIGNRSVMYQVGWSGNLYVECNTGTLASEDPGDFNPKFAGLHSYHPVAGTTNVVSFPGFVDRRSQGSVYGDPAPGNGDYRLMPGAPGILLGLVEPLPYGLSGEARYQKTAGAYEFYPYKLVGHGKSTVRGKATLR